MAGAAVDDDIAALKLGFELIAHADDGGDAHGAGEDGGVAGAGAALGDEAEDLGLVQLHGLAGGKIVGGEDDGHLGVDAALHHAQKDPDNTAGDVLDVGGSCLHVAVVHGGEHLGKLGAHVGDDGLGIAAFFLDPGLNGFLVVQVLAHHLVGLEQERSLVAGFLSGLLGQLAELIDGLGLGGLEAGPFGFAVCHLIAADGALDALEEVEGTRGHAGGYALALDGNHRIVLLFQFTLFRIQHLQDRRSLSAALRRSRCSRPP